MNPVGLPIAVSPHILLSLAVVSGTTSLLTTHHSPSSLAADAGEVAGVFLERGHLRLHLAQAFQLEALLRFDHAPVVVRIDFDELRAELVPAPHEADTALAAGVLPEF